MSVHLQATFDRASFRFNEAGMRALLVGPIARDLVRRGIAVERSAKQHATGRPGPNVITGRLRSSIAWRIGHDWHGVFVDVGTAVEYAPYVELGTSRSPAYPFLRPAMEAARAHE